MIRLDGHYLFRLGHILSKIREIRIWDFEGTPHTKNECLRIIVPAMEELDGLMQGSVFQLRTARATAQKLRDSLQTTLDHCQTTEDAERPDPKTILNLQTSYSEFEAVLKSALGSENIYLVQQKAAFDSQILVEAGEMAFPQISQELEPKCMRDMRSAMKCIAFDLPTAAAFHLHRANEMALGKYWDHISNGRKRPKNQSIGVYISEMEKHEIGDPNVISALRDIKNLHRNPTIHADQSLSSVEDAIDLYGAVRAAISAMAKSARS